MLVRSSLARSELCELIRLLEWLECHNKQYTKEQYNKIYESLEIAKRLYK